MIFGRTNEELDNCLRCNKTISNFDWKANNGVCDDCPKLTEIAPQFWTVINHMALMGDYDAQETLRRYS